MVPLSALLLPILLSAVLVFVVSSILHMVTPWHKGDYPKVPNEDRALDAIRALGIPAGDYMMPRPASREEMKSPAFIEKFKRGPVMVFTIMPSGSMSMGKPLTLWFVYSVVVGIFAAYVAGAALGPGVPFRSVLRLAGTTAFAGYALALWQLSIWYHRSLVITIKATVDGVIYALLTGATLAWLWPKVTA
jgi:hypothetical protein